MEVEEAKKDLVCTLKNIGLGLGAPRARPTKQLLPRQSDRSAAISGPVRSGFRVLEEWVRVGTGVSGKRKRHWLVWWEGKPLDCCGIVGSEERDQNEPGLQNPCHLSNNLTRRQRLEIRKTPLIHSPFFLSRGSACALLFYDVRFIMFWFGISR